jgi:hypothetical protein
MKSFFTRTAMLVVCSLALVCSAHAQAIFDSLGGATVGADSVYEYGPLGASFTTPSTPFTLGDVDVLLGTIYYPEGATDVALYSDSETSPGTELAYLGTVPDVDLSYSEPYLENFNFPLSTPLPLAPDTRYWIVLSTDPEAEITVAGWAYTYNTSGLGVAGEYYYGDGGTYSNSDGPYQMEIFGAPEPGTAGLLILGLGSLGFLGISRRKLLN